LIQENERKTSHSLIRRPKISRWRARS